MTEFATTSELSSRFNENSTHTVRRTIILTEFQGDKEPFATLDRREDIYRILGMVRISVKETHTTVINYNL